MIVQINSDVHYAIRTLRPGDIFEVGPVSSYIKSDKDRIFNLETGEEVYFSLDTTASIFSKVIIKNLNTCNLDKTPIGSLSKGDLAVYRPSKKEGTLPVENKLLIVDASQKSQVVTVNVFNGAEQLLPRDTMILHSSFITICLSH